MKTLFTIIFLGVFICYGNAVPANNAYTLSISVKVKLPQNHLSDTIFIAGNFNKWSPNASPLIFNVADKMWHISLANIKGEVNFKFTRGTWETVQCTSAGADVENYNIKVDHDKIAEYTISTWKDAFPLSPRIHTASKNVHLAKKEFTIPALKTRKKIWIYLPLGYAKTTKNYPVLYMQDGQNLFDDLTSFSGEWHVDEIMDSMINAGTPPSIIVGIENGKERLREYNPYNNKEFGEGEGEDYLDFISKDLKPWIDKHYRTIANADNTIIAGSSMGGLISYYAAITRPQIFGKAGIFSPSFWIAPQILPLTDSLAGKMNNKMFFSIGRKEGDKYVQDMTEVMDHFAEKSSSIIYSLIDEQGVHNEAAWTRAFPAFYKWIMANGANVILNTK